MAQQSGDLAICLMGPTATGKTELAMALADRLPVDLISVDSAMVYRHMDIGSGKPPPELLARYPHRLVDIREPWEQYSAGDFAVDAAGAISDAVARGRLPLLVGGTFLYFRGLVQGLSDLPSADPAFRAALDERAAREGWPSLHAELARVDAAAAARIGVTDRQRIQRALEVHHLTGRPISVLLGRRSPPGQGRFFRVGLVPRDRLALAERIRLRLDSMLTRGFVAEVERLLALPLMAPNRPALRAVGYRQIARFVTGQCSRAEAEAEALAATRQLAKRQLTWLRGETCDLRLEMAAADLPGALEKAVCDVRSRMQYRA
jgi:tRNA dimethylallyltransferase